MRIAEYKQTDREKNMISFDIICHTGNILLYFPLYVYTCTVFIMNKLSMVGQKCNRPSIYRYTLLNLIKYVYPPGPASTAKIVLRRRH